MTPAKKEQLDRPINSPIRLLFFDALHVQTALLMLFMKLRKKKAK